MLDNPRLWSALAGANLALSGAVMGGTWSGAGGAIPDGASLEGPPGVVVSDVVVAGPLVVQDLKVTVHGLSHTWCGDIAIRITHVESGQTATLVHRIGVSVPPQPPPLSFGDSSNYGGDYTFGDQVPGDGISNNIWIQAGAGGTNFVIPPQGYRPSGPGSGMLVPILPVFLGSSGAGTWRLTVEDHASGDTGAFAGWTLEILGNCGNPGDGNCCAPHAGGGCDDGICCTTICTLDFACCEVAWDESCALAAQDAPECACEADVDFDGVSDELDGCPTDPLKSEPGSCGCFVPETDTDGDALPDCLDECPLDPLKTLPGVCGCGVSDVDSDADGTSDCDDECPPDPPKLVPGL